MDTWGPQNSSLGHLTPEEKSLAQTLLNEAQKLTSLLSPQAWLDLTWLRLSREPLELAFERLAAEESGDPPIQINDLKRDTISAALLAANQVHVDNGAVPRSLKASAKGLATQVAKRVGGILNMDIVANDVNLTISHNVPGRPERAIEDWSVVTQEGTSVFLGFWPQGEEPISTTQHRLASGVVREYENCELGLFKPGEAERTVYVPQNYGLSVRMDFFPRMPKRKARLT